MATGKKAVCQYCDRSAEGKQGEDCGRNQGSDEGDTAPGHLLPAPQSPARTHTMEGDAGSASSNPEQQVLFEAVHSPLCQPVARVMIRCKKGETLQLEGLNHVGRRYRCKALLSFRTTEL